MSEKIQSTHRDRAAHVYVRQSTMQQVRHAKEGQKRQYALQTRAHDLGFSKVVVIDDDLGRSGSGSAERPGFGRLLTSVCEGMVGAVFALEASRLARNNRDWHHLIDLCAMTNTLVIDEDGIYDPRLLNDRLLLGLKGSMAEFELGLMRQRAQEALRQMIARGEALWVAPIGLVRTEDNRIEMIPDRQVQQAINGVFAKFRELGSARQVLFWYHEARIPIPHVPEAKADLQWCLPAYRQILAFLQNPAYAGAFVHGRTTTRTIVKNGRALKRAGHRLPIDQWQVVIRDHHPGYITWEEFLQNQKQLEANSVMTGSEKSGAAKNGPGLLAGLLRCGRCGRKLHVAYSGESGRVPRYHCRGGELNHGMPRCKVSFGGFRVDQAVARKVLEAIQPIGIQASMDAWQMLTQQGDEKHKALQLAFEKARYEADRAQRQYEAVDPENRLVAGELERRWNQALEQVAELEQRLKTSAPLEEAVDAHVRSRLLELGQDLEIAWHHPSASLSLKKRILRTVLTELVADVLEDSSETVMWLHWAGGVHTQVRVPRNPTGRHGHCAEREAIELVRDLAKVCSDVSIAAILNRLGYRTGNGNTWIESRVRSIRKLNGIPVVPKKSDRTWVTMQEAARELKISTSSVKRLIRCGILPGKQVVTLAPWVIERESLLRPAVQAAALATRQGRRIPRCAPGQQELPYN